MRSGPEGSELPPVLFLCTCPGTCFNEVRARRPGITARVSRSGSAGRWRFNEDPGPKARNYTGRETGKRSGSSCFNEVRARRPGITIGHGLPSSSSGPASMRSGPEGPELPPTSPVSAHRPTSCFNEVRARRPGIIREYGQHPHSVILEASMRSGPEGPELATYLAD